MQSPVAVGLSIADRSRILHDNHVKEFNMHTPVRNLRAVILCPMSLFSTAP